MQPLACTYVTQQSIRQPHWEIRAKNKCTPRRIIDKGGVLKHLLSIIYKIWLFNFLQNTFCILSFANIQIYLIFASYFQKNVTTWFFRTGCNVSLPRWAGVMLRGRFIAHRGRDTRVTHPPQITLRSSGVTEMSPLPRLKWYGYAVDVYVTTPASGHPF